jgi:hypothetical protein
MKREMQANCPNLVQLNDYENCRVDDAVKAIEDLLDGQDFQLSTNLRKLVREHIAEQVADVVSELVPHQLPEPDDNYLSACGAKLAGSVPAACHGGRQPDWWPLLHGWRIHHQDAAGAGPRGAGFSGANQPEKIRMTPFEAALEDNIKAKIKQLKKGGTTAMAVKNLLQVTPTPQYTLRGAPSGWLTYGLLFIEACNRMPDAKKFTTI